MSELTKGLKKGKAQPVYKCCREVRLWAGGKLGEETSGFNTLTNELEHWICIKVDKNPNNSIVQRIYK